METLMQRIQALEARLNENNVEAKVTDDFRDPPLFFVKQDGSAVNPESFEKIPGVVKDLPVFCGDPSELNSWICDVDGIIRLYQTSPSDNEEKQNKFHMICKFVRRKIRGEANDALVASNASINWYMIRRTLITYYGEKRDLETLDFQLMSAHQKGRSLETYYDEVNRLLSLIANQIKTDERFSHPEASRALIETYNKKAIDAFVRGLDGDVYRFIRNYEPTSLAAAYSYCISFQNVECRKLLTRPRANIPPTAPRNLIPLPPPIPNRNFQNHTTQPRPPLPQPYRNFRPGNYQHKHNPFQNRNMYSHAFPQHNAFPRQPPPEPMDVDRSIRSRQINYGNRPSFSGNNRPPKRPRVNNLQTNDQPQSFDDDETRSLDRYLHTVERQDNSNFDSNETTELHFLE